MTKAVVGRPADSIPAEMAKLEKELADKLGGTTPSRDDVLTYAMFPQVALAFFKTRSQGPAKVTAMEERKPQAAGPAMPATGRFTVTVDGQNYGVSSAMADGKLTVTVDGQAFAVSVSDAAAAPAAKAPQPTGDAATIAAPMPGTIVKLTRTDGDAVAANDTILILEALKMQMEIRSTIAGKVWYSVRPGDTVRAKDSLAQVMP
jgi:oxaloacetate decarboxylase alpha subunit